jgi:hypothetical protein
MLVADRAQAIGFFGLRIAVDVVVADPDARVTTDGVIDPASRRCLPGA